MLSPHRRDALKLALETKRASGGAGSASAVTCASGKGWSLLDVVCCAGPTDRHFEERHSHTSVSFVIAGSFMYRSAWGRAVLVPGAVLLGNAGACFECGHEHAEGDRCISFHFDPNLAEEVAHDIGARTSIFSRPSLPPLRQFSVLYARACGALDDDAACSESLALEVAAATLEATTQRATRVVSRARDIRRVVDTARDLEWHYAEAVSIADLASKADLTRFHFMRLFKQVTGTTAHQFVLRLRLRAAARRLIQTDEPVTTISYEVGFQDLSHFTRSFALEFGHSPTHYRAQAHGTRRDDL